MTGLKGDKLFKFTLKDLSLSQLMAIRADASGTQAPDDCSFVRQVHFEVPVSRVPEMQEV